MGQLEGIPGAWGAGWVPMLTISPSREGSPSSHLIPKAGAVVARPPRSRSPHPAAPSPLRRAALRGVAQPFFLFIPFLSP